MPDFEDFGREISKIWPKKLFRTSGIRDTSCSFLQRRHTRELAWQELERRHTILEVLWGFEELVITSLVVVSGRLKRQKAQKAAREIEQRVVYLATGNVDFGDR
jgi:hypothetical protein